MTQATLAPAAPREVRRALGRVAARLRTVDALRGVGTVALVAATGAILGMVADFAWPLPVRVRWAIWGGWLAISGLVALFSIVRPLVRRLALLDLAALAERGQPELGERIVGAVALIEGGERSHGSPALIGALASEAAGEAGGIEPRRAVGAGRAARRLGLGAVAAAVVVLPPLLRPDPFADLARRLVAPWLDVDRVGRFAIRVEPGDKVVAVGSDLAVVARVTPRIRLGLPVATPDAAWLEWTEADGKARRLRMATASTDDPGTRSFEAKLPRLAGSIRYRVTTAADASRRHDIRCVEPPTLKGIAAVVEPPAYTKLPAGPARDPARIEAVEGSVVAFRFDPSRPVATIELDWPEFGDSEGRTRRVDARPGEAARVVAESAGSYGYGARPVRDEYGLDGPRVAGRLVVRPDAPPALSARPVEATEAGADDVLTVPLTAVDDFAVASAELHYEIKRNGSDAEEPETGKVDLALDGLGTRKASGEAALALKSLGLRPGDAISYRARLADNRPLPRGPNVTWSDQGTLAIVAKAEPILARRDRLNRERVQGRIEEIKKENLSNRHEATQLRYAADSALRNPAAWDADRDRALADRSASARKVVDDLAALARDLDADPAFRPLAGPAREIAEVEAEAGRAALDAAKAAADNPVRRLAELRGADSRLGSTHQRIEELRRQFDELARLDKDRQRLRELAAKEDALAAEAARAGDDRAARAAVRDEQEALRRELDDLAAKSPDLKAGLLEAQAKEAATLAEKARALAARQRDQARPDADARPDAALAALADEQRKIEVDARRLALEVDEALADNGRARVDPRTLRDAVPPIERGEVKEGRERLERAEAELRRLARDLEDAPLDPKALARRLARRQEELARRVVEAVRSSRGKSPQVQAAAARPLAADQQAILRLAEAIRVDEPRQGLAREAVQALGRSHDALRKVPVRDPGARQEEARQALNRLADALPDPWRRDDSARKALDDARRLNDEATRDLDRHLRETAPEAGRPHDPARAAVELSRRLEPLAKKQAEAADKLAAMDASPRADPQRRRAERRARALAALADDLRKEAATLAQAPGGLVPIRDWQVVGPFRRDQAPPFRPDQKVDINARFNGKKGRISWRPTRAVDDRGRVDLGALYSKEDDQSAFASAELDRPEAGPARFAIGSDDNLTVWVDGKQVFNYTENRAYSPEQATFIVPLAKGINRVLVRCGTGNGEWMFGVEVAPPTPFAAELARAEGLRRALPQSALEAKEALDRLGQALRGQVPADDTAEELAAEAAELARSASRPEAQADPKARRALADDARRLSTAVRGLPAPDADALRSEAVRQLDHAARALDHPKLDAGADVASAAKSTRALADRLADRLSPRAEALALADAERGTALADDPGRRQQALAGQAARLEAEALRNSKTPTPHPPPQGGRGPNNPSPLEGEGRVGGQAPGANTPRPAAEATARAAGLADATTPDEKRTSLARAEAAKALEHLAGAAPDAPPLADAPPRPRPLPDAPRDPDLDPLRDRRGRAEELARRERRVRERLQSALNERAGPQEGLRREASALGKELADLRDRSREPSPRGRGHAEAAAELVANQAPRAMNEALDGMAQGRPDAARDAQRRSAELVERAAQSAEDLARALKSDRPESATPADLAPARDALAEARRRLGDAPAGPGEGQGQGAGAPPGPAAAMRQAAQAMRAAARPGQGKERGPGEGNPGEGPAIASGPGTDPKPTPAGAAPADLTELQAMVRQKSGRNWGELPGHLRTEILQLSQGKYRDDYARLIQLYFQEIAADAGSPGRGKKDGN